MTGFYGSGTPSAYNAAFMPHFSSTSGTVALQGLTGATAASLRLFGYARLPLGAV
jgi:hypothetical protein